VFRNRITMYEPEQFQVPHPPVPGPNACAFVWIAVPMTCLQQWTMQQWIYQRAFEQAQAVVRPSIVERDLLGVWN
jgi:hypothetical protein